MMGAETTIEVAQTERDWDTEPYMETGSEVWYGEV